MKRRVDPSPALLRLAAMQDGVLSLEQVGALGLGRNSLARIMKQGQWQRVDRGIYLTVPGEPAWPALAWAGTLLGGDRARLGGLAAAHLHGLVPDAPDDITVLIPHDLRVLSREPWVFQRERPRARSPRTVGGPPRLPVEDTVLDLCDPRLAPNGQSAVHWVTTALQKKITTPQRLRRALSARSFAHDRALLEDLLDDAAIGAESPLEVRYLRDVERAHGLPTGVRQSPRRAGRVERGTRADRDVLYEDYGLIVELDGRTGHADVPGRLRDLRRDNVAALRSETTLRYGWEDVTVETCETAFQVASVLFDRGWPGPLLRCSHCRSTLDDHCGEFRAG